MYSEEFIVAVSFWIHCFKSMIYQSFLSNIITRADFGIPKWLSGVPVQEIQEMQVPSLGWKDPLEEEMATDSSILAWRIPWTEEPGGL